MKKIVFILILFLLLLQTTVVLAEDRTPVYNPITKDYRPLYNFSYNVFKYLPAFPKDFWLKKHLFDTQQIPASRLTPEYYLQPELIPGWFDWCDKTYGNNSPHMVGVYGINMYPSRFDIFGMDINDTVNISTLLYTSFGVEIYQGCKIVLKYDDTCLSVKLVQPESDIFLLKPTYPFFDSEWCHPVTFEVTLKKYGNHTVEIYEEKPPIQVDNNWREKYKTMYTSGGSILGLQVPKMKIFIKAEQINDTNEDNEDNNIVYLSEETVFFLIMVLSSIIIVLWSLYYVSRRQKQEKKDKT